MGLIRVDVPRSRRSVKLKSQDEQQLDGGISFNGNHIQDDDTSARPFLYVSKRMDATKLRYELAVLLFRFPSSFESYNVARDA